MKFQKKPVQIEARQYTDGSWARIIDWVNANGGYAYLPAGPDLDIAIETLEGDMRALPGDWIIQGVKGEFYPCKPDIFEMTYEPVTDE